MSDPHRVLALLHQRRVVDHQDGVRPTNQTVGFLSQKLLQGRPSPGRRRQKVLQWPRASRSDALRHRLDALALAGTEQTLHGQRHPASLRDILQAIQKRRQPVFEVVFPIHSRSRHPTTPDSGALSDATDASMKYRGVVLTGPSSLSDLTVWRNF